MPRKTSPLPGISAFIPEKPCENCGLTPSKISVICGEALLSEAELIRQLRQHGWVSGDPGVLMRTWSRKEVA